MSIREKHKISKCSNVKREAVRKKRGGLSDR
jgi:hypothetical protein